MKHSILLFTFLIALISACTKEDGKGNGSCYSNINVQTIMHDDLNREYAIHVPNSYNGTVPAPLLLNFHGFGGSASDFMNETNMLALAESETFILCYPQGSCDNSGSSHWNPCPVGGDNKSTADDLGFADAMITEIAEQYNVDMERIYAAGYSNGAMMAYGLAHYKSDLIAAVASVSGAMLDCVGPTSHPMPIVHLHGTSDGVLPYNGDMYYSSVQSTLDYWIAFNNTTTNAIINSDNSGGITVEQVVYDQGDNDVSVAHYNYIGGGHVWFNTTYQGQNASELVWNFLSRYDINGLR